MLNLSHSKLNKLKSVLINGTEITVNLALILIRNSNDETNFKRKLLLIDTILLKICKAFANIYTSININLLS